MKPTTHPNVPPSTKPICIGLTCWRWQKSKARSIHGLAQRLGVKVDLTEKIEGLRRHIDAKVSGGNIDQFLGEFVRHC